MFSWRAFLPALLALLCVPVVSSAQERVFEVTLTPTRRAQMAIWVERPDGTFVGTLRLTEATARRGIGNRPGALQMNSGFHWPYGRREGVLPVWAHRRANAEGAQSFRRVIFQNRASEGFASRTSNDPSPDDYFCLSFNQSTTTREALDAVTCASQFNSDKGRYITGSDTGYAEPFEDERGMNTDMRELSQTSLYPPRRDLLARRGADHEDVVRFKADSDAVMPELDAVTMATLAGDMSRTISFNVPESWEDGEYVLFVEVNVEGDYNDTFGPERFPTPTLGSRWDHWAKTFGYPYRGQPSVVYSVPFGLNPTGGTYTTDAAVGYAADVHGASGEMVSMDGAITTNPTSAPGSGGDRLRQNGSGNRVVVRVQPSNVCGGPMPPPPCFSDCDEDRPCETGYVCSEGSCVGQCDIQMPPAVVGEFEVVHHHERSWDQASVSFQVPATEREIRQYQVRVAQEPFEAGMDFGSWGVQAKVASLEDIALVVPVGAAAGQTIAVDLGHLTPQSQYYIGVRSLDSCSQASPVAFGELTTTEIIFTTVSPCFVATATYGTPMAEEIGVLRRFRDRHLRSNAVGEMLVQAYYEHGPALADVIAEDEGLRSVSRALLTPVVAIAELFD